MNIHTMDILDIHGTSAEKNLNCKTTPRLRNKAIEQTSRHADGKTITPETFLEDMRRVHDMAQMALILPRFHANSPELKNDRYWIQAKKRKLARYSEDPENSEYYEYSDHSVGHSE